MANFAVIKDNVVLNVIVAESVEDAIQATGYSCVEYNDNNPAGIGWLYNGIKFTAPIIDTTE